MIEFEVATDDGFLGKRPLTAGNTEMVRVNFEYLFDRGVTATGATATVTSTVSSVSTPSLSDNRKWVYFLVTSGEVSETFTVSLRVTTNDGQTLNFTIVFEVVGPTVSTQDGSLPLLYGPTGATGSTGPAAPYSNNNQVTDYTFVIGDASKIVEAEKATAIVFTIPTNASVTFPVGTFMRLLQIGAGQLSVSPAGGVTLQSSGTKRKLTGQYSAAWLYKRATDTWLLSGDIAT